MEEYPFNQFYQARPDTWILLHQEFLRTHTNSTELCECKFLFAFIQKAWKSRTGALQIIAWTQLLNNAEMVK
jgi:hypothetical protein